MTMQRPRHCNVIDRNYMFLKEMNVNQDGANPITIKSSTTAPLSSERAGKARASKLGTSHLFAILHPIEANKPLIK